MYSETIPELQERICMNCTERESQGKIETKYTLQEPVEVEVYGGSRGCLSRSRPKVQWQWKCRNCGEKQI